MKYIGLLVFFISVFAACKKDKKADIAKEKKTENTVLMLSPAKNEVCAVGTEEPGNMVSMNFSWKPVENETTYIFYIRSLSATPQRDTEYLVSDTSYTLALNKDKVYAWHVVGANSDEKLADEWKFYVSNQTSTYTPLPPTAYYPKQGGIAYYYPYGIDLQWYASGTDIRCDVYFGTSKNPPLIKENLTKPDFSGFSLNVAVEKGTTYYWKVVSKNAFGNQATSPLFQFNVIGVP